MRSFECVVCHKSFEGYGNNPAPLAEEGLCCDHCNLTHVRMARISEASGKPFMTYDQRYAALELGDKLAAFAIQYKLSDVWIKKMYDQARSCAMDTTGIDIGEA